MKIQSDLHIYLLNCQFPSPAGGVTESRARDYPLNVEMLTFFL
jgi:hypothetical protein